MRFLDSIAGQFLVQSSLHSFVALLLAEGSLRIFQVRSARHRFRYRFTVLVLPPLLYPLFQLANPGRGSFYFHQDSAIFSSGRWLRIELLDLAPLAWLFLLLLLASSTATLIQEVFPIVRSWSRSADVAAPPTQTPSWIDEMLSELSAELGIEKPSLKLLSDDQPQLFIDVARRPAILASTGLLRRLNRRQLRVALAHELAHIVRRSAAATTLAFMARLATFFSPVSLLVFRRVIQDDEQVCDEMTVALTGDPEALASALAVFLWRAETPASSQRPAVLDSVVASSHDLLLDERISKLRNFSSYGSAPFDWSGFLLTFGSVVYVCYGIV